MANRLMGEATAQACGRPWTLRLDFNALCHFEEATDRSAFEVLGALEDDPQAVRARDLRALVLACLMHHHPDATASDAGAVLSEDMQALARLTIAAMPAAADLPDAGATTAGNAARGTRRPT